MTTHFFSLGIIMLLAAMAPGPDFAIVTKNTLLHSRRAGIYTALGISLAICVHMTYCVLGVAAVIHESPFVFRVIQYAGAVYLIYLGCMLLKAPSTPFSSDECITEMPEVNKRRAISMRKAFKQGFICNLFNPKATLFFLTLFSVTTTDENSFYINLGYAAEILFVTIVWFSTLAYLLSHQAITPFFDKAKNSIEKILGIGLILLAIGIFVFS
jgi:RhtB (resistance to homoserine/threonine) family protein